MANPRIPKPVKINLKPPFQLSFCALSLNSTVSQNYWCWSVDKSSLDHKLLLSTGNLNSWLKKKHNYCTYRKQYLKRWNNKNVYLFLIFSFSRVRSGSIRRVRSYFPSSSSARRSGFSGTPSGEMSPSIFNLRGHSNNMWHLCGTPCEI